MRRRLDAELVRRGLAPSRSAAQELVCANQVLVSGSLATKAARMVHPGDPLVLRGEPPRFVGRGGEKLVAALERFDLDAADLRVLDAGASTGGFTDCLVQAGAREVVALDVGHGQLHERLRGRSEVMVLEHTNLRHVTRQDLGTFDAAVADLSFISLTKVLDVLFELVEPAGWMVLLVKPQFECGRIEVSRGRGVVRDPALWKQALARVAGAAVDRGGIVAHAMVSPLRGGEGNVEFLLHLATPRAPVEPNEPISSVDPTALVRSAVESAAHREGLA